MDEKKYMRSLAILKYLAEFQRKNKKSINFETLKSEFQATIYESEFFCKKLLQKFVKNGLLSVKNPSKMEFFEEKITKTLINLSN